MEINYTVEQVAEHNQPGDAWIIIEDKVYDISKFSKMHPGGTVIILEYAGQDATSVFQQFHPMKTLKRFPKLKIGRVADKEVAKKTKKDVLGDQIPYGENSYFLGSPSPYYNESHTKMAKYIRDFCNRNLSQDGMKWEEQGFIPQEVFQLCAKHGLLQCAIGAPWQVEFQGNVIPGGVKPEEFDWFHYKVVTEEMSRPCGSGLTWGLSGGLGIGLPPVMNFGSDELKKRIAPDCLAGKKNICLAITEPQAGSDVANLTTNAKLSEDGKFFIVNGIKKWITNGIRCDYFTTAVRIGKKKGMAGVSLLLIEKAFQGVTLRKMKCQGMTMSGTTYIVYENVHVPVENMIGEKGFGFYYIMANFNQERLGIIFQMISLCRVCFEDFFKFAHQRETFGKKLVQHPVIRNKFAHMARMIESVNAWSEILTYQLIKLGKIKATKVNAGPISLLKAQASITLEYCAREAVQIFGGLGYTKGGLGERVERIYREVRGLAIPAGSEEIMLDLGVRQAMRFFPAEAKL